MVQFCTPIEAADAARKLYGSVRSAVCDNIEHVLQLDCRTVLGLAKALEELGLLFCTDTPPCRRATHKVVSEYVSRCMDEKIAINPRHVYEAALALALGLKPKNVETRVIYEDDEILVLSL